MQQVLIGLRIIELLVLSAFLLHFYARYHNNRTIVAAVFCLFFALCDFMCGLVFGYWSRNPVGLLVLYVIQWIAVICFLGLGYAFVTNEFAFTIVLWGQTLLFYVGFSLKINR